MVNAPGKLIRNARYVLLCTAVVGSAAAALAAAPAASAETDYSCESCYETNGPNEWIDYVGATNYTYDEVNGWIWKYNSDGSYSMVWHGVSSKGGDHIEDCLGYEHRVKGHGESSVLIPQAHLSGKEWLWGTFEGPCV